MVEVNRLLLDAVFINNSGGKVLLEYLINTLEKKDIDVFYLLDDRCKDDFKYIPDNKKSFIAGSIISRHLFYKRNAYQFKTILCFGNVPPTIKTKAKVFTYFHNVTLLEPAINYSPGERYLQLVKGWIISLYTKNSDFFCVQTPIVKQMLCVKLKVKPDKCLVLPFYNVAKISHLFRKENSFLFVSNGNTHKNHDNLLKAWHILADKGLFPTLHLTVTDNYKLLNNKISEAVNNGLNIINHGFTNPYKLYESCKYLVYPSLCESFGLGLIEAVNSGCEAIAADLPYIYEVIHPCATFDPLDPISIASKIELAYKEGLTGKSQIITSNKIDDFINYLTK